MSHSIPSAVVVKNLSVQFGTFYAVNNISFEVKTGEIFGFLGANGAGKTTTIRVLCGLITPTEGKVSVAGIEFDNETDEMKIKRKVGYMSQRLTLYDDLTVEENLYFIASLRNMSYSHYIERRKEILDFISFDRPLNSFVRDLPGGIKQQVSLASSIIHDPDIIFLDEPTAGVTPAMRQRFWELINLLAKNHKTVFVTTHYMDEAEQCDRIALMRTGKIILLNSPDKLKKEVFPEEIFEFIPIEKLSYSTIEQLSKRPEFEYFEPYGLRFHASFKNTENEKKMLEYLKPRFKINRITPKLEDVFIKKVEGKEEEAEKNRNEEYKKGKEE